VQTPLTRSTRWAPAQPMPSLSLELCLIGHAASGGLQRALVGAAAARSAAPQREPGTGKA